MKHPIYTAFAFLACVYLAEANTRGWRLMTHLSPFHWAAAAGFGSSNGSGWAWGSNAHGAFHK